MSLNSLKSKTLKRITVAAVTVMALTLGSSYAFAQHGGGGGHGGGAGGGGHAMSGGSGHAMSGGGHAQSGGGPAQPGGGHMGPARPDSNHNRARSSEGGNFDRRHSDSDRRGSDHRDRDSDHRDHDRDRRHFDRDDFGIFFGDPFLYRYPYWEHDYFYPGVGYPDAAYGNAARVEYGGVTFAITPADALVYVDNNYVGIASSFASGSQPLSLPAGSHRIELLAPGYEPMTFDVNVIVGEVVPYQGSLKPASHR